MDLIQEAVAYTLRNKGKKSAWKGTNACHWGGTLQVHNIVQICLYLINRIKLISENTEHLFFVLLSDK